MKKMEGKPPKKGKKILRDNSIPNSRESKNSMHH